MKESSSLTTEAINPLSEKIDTLSPLEIVQLMNAEDAKIAEAVAREADSIAKAIEVATGRIRSGGRLVYIGAGTSGRLGVLDASECPPTFNTPAEMVVGLIAGGDTALRKAAEGVEDHPEAAVIDLKAIDLTGKDVLVGIASSGRTPYVIGALDYAREVGAYAIGLVCNENSQMASHADLMLAPVVGPEIISGSTRMKAGTATKMVLNMISTGTMVQLGKTFGNYMVDLRASNSKLIVRSRRIAAALAGITEGQAEEELKKCDGELKTTVVMLRKNVSPQAARTLLEKHGGQLRLALEEDLQE
ncbi:N-acetylmuramic acid 6-phosphate etherase [Thalassoglobus polymorphus]|uniref:N-acetylmuramic acid 6-phosphate etherase n=2 Tax=Thalassoglobus polymorphus TaxID=2527994 RepID=A0A517QTQ7_9PLAN|nr:N-acetylmuramic acid 6-phosphate etherase [Thalassoglobus polymorphus]QDT35021.1 N-acetylmuramic acid 6-phosphate etherase [Thalassoglobus polymorphus]